MNQENLEHNIGDLKDGGILLIDESSINNIPQKEAKVVRVPATRLAQEKFGDKLYANMIALGALVKTSRIIRDGAMEQAIRDSVPEKAVERNLEAYHTGKELISLSQT